MLDRLFEGRHLLLTFVSWVLTFLLVICFLKFVILSVIVFVKLNRYANFASVQLDIFILK